MLTLHGYSLLRSKYASQPLFQADHLSLRPFPLLAVCQKEDWKAHRSICKSLMGGTWRRLTFVPATHPIPGLHAIFVNRFTNVFHGELEDQVKKLKPDRKSIPNTHGSAPFVVKVQLNSLEAGGMLGPLYKIPEGPWTRRRIGRACPFTIVRGHSESLLSLE